MPPNKEQQKEREKLVWSLRMKGWTHEMIADELGLERSTITKMLGRLSLAASKELTDTLIEEKYAQLAQLRHVVAEAMEAWERSKQVDKTMTTRNQQATDKKGNQTALPGGEVTVKIQESDGDPRYLEAANRARADIRKLLGLDAPTKIINLDRLDNATDEQLERIIAGEDPLVVFSAEEQ